nr:PREDICTED: uncharacterized protein LOC107079821 [Lepisosteus oculatus]
MSADCSTLAVGYLVPTDRLVVRSWTGHDKTKKKRRGKKAREGETEGVGVRAREENQNSAHSYWRRKLSGAVAQNVIFCHSLRDRALLCCRLASGTMVRQGKQRGTECTGGRGRGRARQECQEERKQRRVKEVSKPTQLPTRTSLTKSTHRISTDTETSTTGHKHKLQVGSDYNWRCYTAKRLVTSQSYEERLCRSFHTAAWEASEQQTDRR